MSQQRRVKLRTPHADQELRHMLYFVSEDIRKVQYSEGHFIIDLHTGTDLAELVPKLEHCIQVYGHSQVEQRIIKTFKNNERCCSFEETEEPEMVSRLGDGFIRLRGEAVRLFRFFDHSFRNMAVELGAVEAHYPALLPLEGFIKTGYLATFPQYTTFVGHVREDMDCLSNLQSYAANNEMLDLCNEPQYVLSPAACFHCFYELQQQQLDRPVFLTFVQQVSRNEGRSSWEEKGRLRDYKVRELVFIGEENDVRHKREKIMEETVRFVEHIGLTGNLSVAHDHFVLPSLQKYKLFQSTNELKYELRLSLSNSQTISVASFNLHGNVLTLPFEIGINQVDVCESGCVGFGLERWVICFLAQFGNNVQNWPDSVRHAL